MSSIPDVWVLDFDKKTKDSQLGGTGRSCSVERTANTLQQGWTSTKNNGIA